MPSTHVLVVGAGIFGVTASLALRSRGHRVSLLDPGPVPHPLAASTDISKVIRMEYGADETYMALAEEARSGWLEWNDRWAAEGRSRLYHETGVLMICQDRMAPGSFEHESWQMLHKRGHAPERMDLVTITKRFPAWSTKRFIDGFFHAEGGFAESGNVVAALVEWARRDGVEVHEGITVGTLVERGGRVTGVRDRNGREVEADEVVVAAGAWTGKLTGTLAESIRVTGHPVFHLRPPDPELFRAERFPTFTADVAQTGYYGFPLSANGVVKIANHGLGRPVEADGPREVTQRDHERLRVFVADTFPALVNAEVVYTRLCLYADTQDEDFWIARDPGREGLTVASGGSGHGFKFAPVLGKIIADAMEEADNPLLSRFAWRPGLRLAQGREAARCHARQ